MIKMSYGQDINDKLFNRFDQIERKKFEKKIDENIPNQIFSSFPDDKILEENTAISFLTKSTGLDEDTIIRSVNELIKSKKLITAQDRQNRLHLRKNPF